MARPVSNPHRQPLEKARVLFLGLFLVTCPDLLCRAAHAQDQSGKHLAAVAGSAPSRGQEPKILQPETPGSTGFTYQGQLKDANGPVNGVFDFQFTLHGVQTGGDSLGLIERKDVPLVNGLFSLELDFGPARGEVKESWLEIGVRPGGTGGPFTVLFPRQKLTTTPYAIFTQRDQWSLIGVPVGFGDRNGAVVQSDALAESAKLEKPKEEQSMKPETKTAASPQGTANYIAKFDAAGNATANSILYEAGSGAAASVGIGTTSPATKLDVRGHLTLEAGASPVLYTGTGNTELNRYLNLINTPAAPSASGLKAGGILVSDSYSYADPGKNDLIVKGNTGLGTATPAAKLHLSGRVGAISPFQGLLIEQTINPAGNFEGYTFQVKTNSLGAPPQIPATTTTDFIIDTFGNVGIGTATPNHRLSIGRGPLWTSNQWGGSVELTNGAAIAWQANDSGQRFGIGHTNGGLYFFRTASDPGTRTSPARYDLSISDGGLVSINVLQIQGGADLSENFDVSDVSSPGDPAVSEAIQPGMVVVIDPEHPGRLMMSRRAYDHRVAGIVSGAEGIKPAMVMGQEGSIADGKHPIALTGRVYGWADASFGSIEPGDLLTSSDTPGYAMKAKDRKKALGAILGKAMTGLKTGRGPVLILVTLQ